MSGEDITMTYERKRVRIMRTGEEGRR